MLAAFVIVFGFVTAGLIASVSAIYQNNNGSIELSMETPFGAIKGFLLCMFVGPYIIAKNSLVLWIRQKIGLPLFGACLLAAIIWSFCVGIVAIQSLLAMGVL